MELIFLKGKINSDQTLTYDHLINCDFVEKGSKEESIIKEAMDSDEYILKSYNISYNRINDSDTINYFEIL